MSRDARKARDRAALDYLYYTCDRIHRLAEARLPRTASAATSLRAGTARPEARRPARSTAAQRALGSVAEQFAARMIATFGGKSMVDGIGRWVDYAARKRGER